MRPIDVMIHRHRPPESTILLLDHYDTERSQMEEIPLRFIEIQGHPHVLYPANAPPLWVGLATESHFVRWRVGSHRFIGTAVRVRDSSRLQGEILPQYAAKFGAERVSRWFGSQVGCVTLVESEDVTPYHRAVEALFDRSASKYDRIVQSNRFDMHLRKVALEILKQLFQPGHRVLELGCGTGLETIPLARAGVDLVALDISSGMLMELERKARAGPLAGRIETRKGSISQLADIVSDFGPGSFDGAFSHFGALNCEPNLDAVPGALHELVKPGGRISLGVWNRTCLAEIVLFALGLRPGRALARLQSAVPIGRSRFGVPVFPHSPAEVERLFWPQFSLERAVGVSIFVPPYNLARHVAPHAKLVSLLEAADRVARDRPFLRYLGDHFLFEMRRR